VAFTSILVTGGPYEGPDGSVATGEVRFRLTHPMTLGHVVVGVDEIVVPLNASGSFSHTLLANDDVGVEPPNVSYEVTEAIDDVTPEVRYVRIPHTAAGGTIDLAAL